MAVRNDKFVMLRLYVVVVGGGGGGYLEKNTSELVLVAVFSFS